MRDALVVSTTPMIRDVLRDVFRAEGYQCQTAIDGREAIALFRTSRPSLVVTDFNLPDMSALELLPDLRREDPHVAIVVLCDGILTSGGKVVGLLDVDAVRRVGVELGAHAFLEKPVEIGELLRAAEGALEAQAAAQRQQESLERHWGAVRHMVTVSEVLAMLSSVFIVPSRHESERNRDA